MNRTIVYSNDPKELLWMALTSARNLHLWSKDSLWEFLTGTVKEITQFCELKKEEIHSESIKSFLRKARDFKVWAAKTLQRKPQSQQETLRKIYSIILSFEGYGLLTGFGLSNKHGDRLAGNPEVSSIYQLPFLENELIQELPKPIRIELRKERKPIC